MCVCVCASTLWLALSDTCLVQVLLSVCSLLTDPNPDDPLVPDIAHMCACAAPMQACSSASEPALLPPLQIQDRQAAIRGDGQGVDAQVRVRLTAAVRLRGCQRAS